VEGGIRRKKREDRVAEISMEMIGEILQRSMSPADAQKGNRRKYFD